MGRTVYLPIQPCVIFMGSRYYAALSRADLPLLSLNSGKRMVNKPIIKPLIKS